MENISEELLSTWLKLSSGVSNERLCPYMPYNESLICNILYRNPERKFTATDLCNETKILKSQMNRTLTSMEKKQLIVRERSMEDKRNVWIRLNQAQIEVYLNQHTKIIALVNTIVERFGAARAEEMIVMLKDIIKIADEVIQ